MKADIVKIGNSQGIRIPKAIIKQCGFEDQVDVRVEGASLIITRGRVPREGWEAAFAGMAEGGDDQLLLPERLEHGWDEAEWRW